MRSEAIVACGTPVTDISDDPKLYLDPSGTFHVFSYLQNHVAK